MAATIAQAGSASHAIFLAGAIDFLQRMLDFVSREMLLSSLFFTFMRAAKRHNDILRCMPHFFSQGVGAGEDAQKNTHLR
ncbi:MAG TPA: hypothetical protein VK654_06145 [Nitrospirota bacterium]|nr:hypothetical protein [Nitrospirota bacterium]